MRVAVIANCQGEGVARCLAAMGVGFDFQIVRPGDIAKVRIEPQTELVLVQDEVSGMAARLLASGQAARLQQVTFPAVYFTAFHPDFVYVRSSNGWLKSPIASANSAIITAAWMRGYSVTETVALFREDTFRELGYFDHWDISESTLLDKADALGMDLRDELGDWRRTGCFLHCPNHPKTTPLAGLARSILGLLKIQPKVKYPESLVSDQLSNNLIWPVYPEIAESFGLRGEYIFRGKEQKGSSGEGCYDLEQFVSSCFDLWRDEPKDGLVCGRFDDPRLEKLESLRRRPLATGKPVNPYAGLPAHQRWKLAVAKPDPGNLDPMVSCDFTIGRDDRVATAGSCFAQHISRALTENGYHFYNVENGKGLPKDEAIARNFGVFSARFGNIYTVRQLLQLLDRSEGRFRPQEKAWQREDGRFVDPFRPLIEPAGFASPEEVDQAREAHFAFVRKMWRKCAVFVFTLGLTEAWVSRADGAVFPVAPGVHGGSFDPDRHAFHNFDGDETIGDLREFLAKLRAINPAVRVILTVSPVPLIATADNRHALVATTYSKSVLRVAAEDVSRIDPRVEYFPSYEIITGSYNRGAYFEDDLRSVTANGVAHVMRVFMKHFSGTASAADANETECHAEVGEHELAAVLLRNEVRSGLKVVCDEEEVERSMERQAH